MRSLLIYAGCNIIEGAGLAKDCMKHDVCSVFKSVLTREAAYGFCDDIDCGDEAFHTVVGCFKKRQWYTSLFSNRQVCNEADFISEPDLYFADLSTAGDTEGWGMGHIRRESCSLYDSWEMGQGVPLTLRENDMPCANWQDCLSGRCETQGDLTRRCKPRKDNGQTCSENWDCIDGRCDWHYTWRICKARLSSAEPCNENTDCLTDKCCDRGEMGCTFCNRRCAHDEEEVGANNICSF